MAKDKDSKKDKTRNKKIERVERQSANAGIAIGRDVTDSVVIVGGSGDIFVMPPSVTSQPPIEKDSDNGIPLCPYRELFSFDEEHAGLFFGREAFVESLVREVKNKSLVALVGPSGSGKSSVVFAGLLPHLRKDDTWLLVNMRPGAQPFQALAAALIPLIDPTLSDVQKITESVTLAQTLQKSEWSLSNIVPILQKHNPKCRRILLAVDQFEELYTSVGDSVERNLFIDKVIGLRNETTENNVTLLLTLRADFFGQVLAYRPLADALQDSDLKLGPMNLEELRRAIEMPAKIQGVKFESGLVDLIIDDLTRGSGTLPFLEFALTKLWEHQKNRELTLDAYQEIGGVENALTQYADTIFKSLKPDELEKARRVFTQLINPGVGIVETRRLAMLKDLNENDARIVETFVQKRLLMTGQDTVEIVHEALIHGSKILHEWIEKDREFLNWHAQLRVSMQPWYRNEKPVDALLFGLPLSIAEKWLSDRKNELNQDERIYILYSIEARNHAEKIRIRKRQFMYSGVFGSIATILVILFVSYFGIKSQSDQARANNLIVQSKLLSTDSPELSLLLAIETLNIPSPYALSAEQSLRDSLNEISGIPLSGHNSTITYFTTSLDGRWLATASRDHTVRLWDLASMNPFNDSRPLETENNDTIISIAISPDSRFLAAGSRNNIIYLWDLKNNSPKPQVLRQHGSPVNFVAFSPDGHWLAAGSSDTTVSLWKLDASNVISLSKMFSDARVDVSSLEFSPDGRWLAIKDGQEIVWLWDIVASADTHDRLMLEHPGNNITNFTFSPDSHWIATAGSDFNIRLWDLKSENPILTGSRSFFGHTDTILGMAFSSDNHWLASYSQDKRVRLWDLKGADSGLVSDVNFYENSDGISSLAFSLDGKWLAISSNDGSTRLWDFRGMTSKTTSISDPMLFHSGSGSVDSVSFSPDNRWLMNFGLDGSLQLWDISAETPSGAPVILHDVNKSTYRVPLDGKWLIAQSHSLGPNLRLWDMTGDNPSNDQTLLKEHDGRVSVRVSPRGDWVATNSYDSVGSKVKLWDMADVDDASVEINYPSVKINDIEFGPYGDMLVTGDVNNKACLWEIPEKGPVKEPKKCFIGDTDEISDLDISPDGNWLATGSKGGTVRIWDLKGLASVPYYDFDSTEKILSVKFSPDGNWLIARSADSAINLWNLSDPAQPQPVLIQDQLKRISAIDFSPNGRWLAMGGGAEARLWDLSANKVNLAASIQLSGINSGIRALQFSPDNLQLAVGTEDVYLWDLQNIDSDKPIPPPISLLDRYTGVITLMEFSPDQKWLAASDWDDKTILLWNLTTSDPAKNLLILNGHKNKITSFIFSSNGKWLISGSWDHTVRFWSLDIEDVVRSACELVGRNLSQKEWDNYFADMPYQETCPQWSDEK